MLCALLNVNANSNNNLTKKLFNISETTSHLLVKYLFN